MTADRGLLPPTDDGLGERSRADDASIPHPGEVVAGKYEIERVLGRGGMGVVVSARHLQLGHRVAIKFKRRAADAESTPAERFLQEARAAAQLSSEHVARVLDFGRTDAGVPYIVMEHLQGIDLQQVLQRDGPMPAPRAVALVLQACEAIAEAHALGIVHRDLKPANLFLSTRRDGAVVLKVLDFGISKVTGAAAGAGAQVRTTSGLFLGSPSYMAPEQARSAECVDARADVWALGVILFELITGVRPFDGASVAETLARVAVPSTAPSMRRFRPEVPE
ncbi:MAG TPA: serine/threonine-protein kinase, partial [Polyangiaceae bacterium]|nr:serine/threonine-protein kinase [Polyangiaceae bacterium]